MKTQDPHSELQDGFEVAPLPPIGPDGAPQIPPQRADPPVRPSLCQAGPCRRYHRLVVQVDAATPGAVRLPIAPAYNHTREDSPRTPCPECAQGVLYRAPAAFHVQTHHYCYPDTGIEMPLGALPVVECNRWDPGGVFRDSHGHELEASTKEDRIFLFWQREAGADYRARVGAWEAARAAEQSEAAEAERLIAQSMADTPTIACQVCGQKFEKHELDDQMRCRSCNGVSLQPRSRASMDIPPRDHVDRLHPESLIYRCECGEESPGNRVCATCRASRPKETP